MDFDRSAEKPWTSLYLPLMPMQKNPFQRKCLRMKWDNTMLVDVSWLLSSVPQCQRWWLCMGPTSWPPSPPKLLQQWLLSLSAAQMDAEVSIGHDSLGKPIWWPLYCTAPLSHPKEQQFILTEEIHTAVRNLLTLLAMLCQKSQARAYKVQVYWWLSK